MPISHQNRTRIPISSLKIYLQNTLSRILITLLLRLPSEFFQDSLQKASKILHRILPGFSTVFNSEQNPSKMLVRINPRFPSESYNYSRKNLSRILILNLPGFALESFKDSNRNPSCIVIENIPGFLSKSSQYSD